MYFVIINKLNLIWKYFDELRLYIIFTEIYVGVLIFFSLVNFILCN